MPPPTPNPAEPHTQVGVAPVDLTVRRLLVDLSAGFGRHWHSGDAFRTQFHNALSMSFPVGEQSFIDSVRAALAYLPETPQNNHLRQQVALFIGQEATHRHVHGLYNAQLEKQGLVNRWQHWGQRRVDLGKSRGLHARHLLAVTAAYEHCTAVFADGALRYAEWFEEAEPAMRTLWRWHAAEETEHRAIAFDLYTAVGGNYRFRIGWYLYAVSLFVLEAAAQTALNLWHDKTLFSPRTWWSALRFYWGPNGLVWRCTVPMLRYFKPSFHPNQDPHAVSADALAHQWLTANRHAYRVVR